MIVIVSSPALIHQEGEIINSLFEADLNLFHVRKPEFSDQQVAELLQNISPVHRSKVVLHQAHQLGTEMGFSRFHLKEFERKQLDSQALQRMKEDEFWYSTSVHREEDYVGLDAVFDYVFFGPVYESISKVGYKPNVRVDFTSFTKGNVKLLGIGGITAENCRKNETNGLDGIALCGAIWQAENKVEAYLKVKERWEN